MVARLLRWLLAAQVLSAGLIGVLLLGHDAPGWLALAAGLGALLVLRLAIVANNFAMSWHGGSPTPPRFQLGPLQHGRLLLGEFQSTVSCTSWILLWSRSQVRVQPDQRAAPVLLLHGYGCNSAYWGPMQARLDTAGISNLAIDLEPIFCPIDDYVPQVAAAVEALCRASGAARVTLVAHSMGGLVARAYLRAHGTARVARVITLGTPHQGSRLARFGPGHNARQMVYGDSAWLRALADSEDAATRALIVSLFTHHDNMVAPQTSSELDGARHIEFGGIGHVALGRNSEVIACVAHLAAEMPIETVRS